MTDILAIDNFSKLAGLPNNTTWLKATYPTFNTFTGTSYAQQTVVEGKTQLNLVGRTNSLANWSISVALPAEPSSYTLGLRILGTPGPSQGSASMGVVANPTATEHDIVLAIELTPTGANLHYKDADGPKVQQVDFPYTDNDTYIDWTFHKISETVNEMSRFTLTVNNFPAFTGDIFNNAGTDLALVFAGVLSTEPDSSEGYLRHHTVEDLAPTNLGYSITDMYVSKNGKRFGMPEVNSANISSVTGNLTSSNPDLTVPEVLEAGPQDWDFAQGYGPATATYEAVEGEVTQVRTILQTQDQEISQVTLTAGGETKQASAYWEPSSVSVVVEGSPNEATLEIG